jgi:hypothetical protein
VFTAGLASTILWAQFTSLTYTASPIPSPDRTSHTPPFEAFSLLQSHELSWGEITAIQFVADNLHSGEAVATMGSLIFPFADNYYYMRVNLLGGLLRNQTIWLVTFYALMNKSDIYQKLSAAKVRFIYLTTDDLNVLRSHEVLYAAITGLAVAFKNNQATVYSFPPQFL